MDPVPLAGPSQSRNARKREFQDFAEARLSERDRRGKFNAAYREDDRRFMRFLVPPGKRVLELGCGLGELLAALKPCYGVGVDFAVRTVAKARERYPDLHFVLGDVRRSGDAGSDRGAVRLHRDCRYHRHVRGYRRDDEPILKLAELVHLRSRQPRVNYIATVDFLNLVDLADFEVISREQRQLIPLRLFGFGPLVNRYVAPPPGIRRLCLRTYLVGRPVRQFPDRRFSASILIPCRNEKGNIENAIRRMPR
ncbi:class I SAM-dependent methyltransferase [Bradyrhizobium sp.]|uniref:class I SAM-dependent methyltransferase n=1 Tax=Bradyrhizobium sp. TaxID=376 RepID=UPI0025B94B6D|nr:class I SAM-dependent methyltransferase [Bradyrhizobium sp.]